MRTLRLPLLSGVAALLLLPALAVAQGPARAQTGGAKPKPPASPASPAAAPAPAPVPAPMPTGPALSAEQMKGAAAFDEMTVPTPGELFAALGKQCKPNWSSEYRGPIPTAYADRAQIALNLGGLIADGYIAVEAMDGQQVKNLGRDILKLAGALGVAREILDRGKTINQFAEQNDWNSLKEELEATQNEVKQAMDAKRDEELTALVTLGGWVRGTQVVSDVVMKNFSDANSSLLRQPGLVAYLRAKLAALPPREQEKTLIKSLSTQLETVEKLVSFPAGTAANKEDVQKIHEQAGAMIKDISTKL